MTTMERGTLATYGYPPAERYTLTRDGKPLMIGTEAECWNYLHATHACSVSHALRWEGYKLEPASRPAQAVQP